LQANGIVGEHDTAGEEIVVSALANTLSLGAGQYFFKTDGFRENNDLKDSIFNIFAQWSPTPNTSVQAEFRRRESEFGDLSLNFYPEVFTKGLRQEPDYNLIRIGARQQFAPGSDLIGSFIYKDSSLPATVTDPGFSVFALTGKEESYIAEAQYLQRTKYFNVILGGGYVSIDGTQETSFVFEPDPTFNFSATVDADQEHTNGYVYTYINYLKTVTLTLGVSYDHVQSDVSVYNKEQWNPKFGITWNPIPDTTIRAAAFRVLKRTLVTEQTLEPTQVAGFNQFFDEVNSTDYWTYGIALDQKFTTNLYGGVEFGRRDLTVPFEFLIPDFVAGTTDWTDKYANVYANWAPHRWISLNAGYQYEKTERGFGGNFNVAEMETQRVPLGGNFFHPSGFSAGVKATWYDQKGTFLIPNAPLPTPDFFAQDSDKFWLVDAAISYRLPQRYGMIILGAKNLFDQQFKYQDTDVNNPTVQPTRTFFAKINISL
jgi:hypothetical protein